MSAIVPIDPVGTGIAPVDVSFPRDENPLVGRAASTGSWSARAHGR
jgi:hypothetical protein